MARRMILKRLLEIIQNSFYQSNMQALRIEVYKIDITQICSSDYGKLNCFSRKNVKHPINSIKYGLEIEPLFFWQIYR